MRRAKALFIWRVTLGLTKKGISHVFICAFLVDCARTIRHRRSKTILARAGFVDSIRGQVACHSAHPSAILGAICEAGEAMAAHRKLDRLRVCLCAGALRKRCLGEPSQESALNLVRVSGNNLRKSSSHRCKRDAFSSSQGAVPAVEFYRSPFERVSAECQSSVRLTL